jgi:predicted nucleotidyltransferase
VRPLKDAAEVQAEFKQALEEFTAKLRKDDQVVAAILMGSLSYDQVWEKSDIDLKLIVQDQKMSISSAAFTENNVPINASIMTRNEFKRLMERSVNTSFEHSILLCSKLLFTKDETIRHYFDDIGHVGSRDRQLMLLLYGCQALNSLAKAEKWYYVKKDLSYSAFWLIKMVDLLTHIEVVLNGAVPMRESVQQALVFNPDFFQAVYSDMVRGSVDELKIRTVLERVNSYLEGHTKTLFGPVLEFLRQEGDIRTISDIKEKFASLVDLNSGLLLTACDWLTERGMLMKLTSETTATPKSRVKLEEPAFLYEP